MRRRIRGWPPIVKIGYGEKKTLRGLHPSGLKEVLVHNLSELAKIDPKVGAARISHTIGEKKRIAILEKAREMGVKVLNPGLKREGAESEAVAETLPLPSEPAKEEALKT
jgi:large subunit ribosomal protein L32e